MKKFKTVKKLNKTRTPLRILRTEYVSLDKVKLWPDNPRKNHAVNDLCELLLEHGQMTPIVVWVKDNIIYKGNTTWKAVKKLGWDKIWVAYADFKNEKQAVAYGLGDNKSSEWAEWDDAILAQLIPKHFKQSPADISRITGFKEAEISDILIPSEDKIPDELPEVDIHGVSPTGKVDYLVIQFEDNRSMKKFKNEVDPDNEHPRIVSFEKLNKYIKGDWDTDGSARKKDTVGKGYTKEKSRRLKRRLRGK